MTLFKNLRAILEVKRRTLKQAGEQLAGYEDTNAQGFDRFVVRDWGANEWKSRVFEQAILRDINTDK